MTPRAAIRPLIFCVLSACLLLNATDARALRPHVRDGWLVGLGFGFGAARFTTGDGVEVDLERGTTPQFRVGKAFNSRFALLVDYTGWLIEDGDIAVEQAKFRRSFQSIGLSFTWYPGGEHPAWGGLSFRAGAGYGWGSVAEVPLKLEDGQIVQEHGHREDEGGLGLVFSMGYEFRLVEHFAVGAAANANFLSINKDFYEKAATFPVTLNASWYW